jgi:hypothetical protein
MGSTLQPGLEEGLAVDSKPWRDLVSVFSDLRFILLGSGHIAESITPS